MASAVQWGIHVYGLAVSMYIAAILVFAIERAPVAKGVVAAMSGVQMFIRGMSIAALALNMLALLYPGVSDKETQMTIAATRFLVVALCMTVAMMDPVVYATLIDKGSGMLSYPSIYGMFGATWFYGVMTAIGLACISVKDSAIGDYIGAGGAKPSGAGASGEEAKTESKDEEKPKETEDEKPKDEETKDEQTKKTEVVTTEKKNGKVTTTTVTTTTTIVD
ncbi:hypothetical protein IW146_007730 [Coemansia sp. RSA 922]|nr:hypothetical protein GGI16_005941 [Coemansia sp. S142-1]KAJ2097601.1 hypothetical protein GGI09_003742 [Coemansia sp. S100]KAJ2106565.1 hypothetical protein IW146_007730 [Coemansia sp. RSA 922]